MDFDREDLPHTTTRRIIICSGVELIVRNLAYPPVPAGQVASTLTAIVTDLKKKDPTLPDVTVIQAKVAAKSLVDYAFLRLHNQSRDPTGSPELMEKWMDVLELKHQVDWAPQGTYKDKTRNVSVPLPLSDTAGAAAKVVEHLKGRDIEVLEHYSTLRRTRPGTIPAILPVDDVVL